MHEFQMLQDCPNCERSFTPNEIDEGRCNECDFTFDVKQYTYALSSPDVYSTRVETTDGTHSVLELAKAHVEGKIIATYGILAVTTIGIECLTHEYSLTYLELNVKDWSEHMESKSWINMVDFKKATKHALTLA